LLRKLLKSKIHRATVTAVDLDYEGSISIDAELMKAVDLVENEAVQVWNLASGARIETYAIPAEAGSGEVRVNGAAAHLFRPGELVIIAAFAWIEDADWPLHKARIVLVDEHNRLARETS